MTDVDVVAADPADARLALRASGVLAEFNRAGVLTAADVHVAMRLGALAGVADEAVLLAAALAVRGAAPGPRLRRPATVRDDGDQRPRRARRRAGAAVAGRRRLGRDCSSASPLVAVGDDGAADRPLRLDGTPALPRPLLARGAPHRRRPPRPRRPRPPAGSTRTLLTAGLDRCSADRRRRPPAGRGTRRPSSAASPSSPAARAPARRRPSPASSPCSTSRPRGRPAPATRRPRRPDRQGGGPPGGGGARTRRRRCRSTRRCGARCWRRRRRRCTACSAGVPDSRSRFRHDRRNRLPHDVVVVDETSMVSLSLMAKLVEAVRDRRPPRARRRPRPARLASRPAPCSATSSGRRRPSHRPQVGPIAGGIVVLRRVHRFGGAHRRPRRGDPARRRRRHDRRARATAATDVRWIAVDVAERRRESALAAGARRGRRRRRAGSSMPPRPATPPRRSSALRAMRVLVRPPPRPVRRRRSGPARIERWLAAAIAGYADAGAVVRRASAARHRERLRPAAVQRRHRRRRRVRGDGRRVAVFERGGDLLEVSPRRLVSGRHRPRHDDPQEPGLAVRRRRRDPPRRRRRRSSPASCSTPR